MVFLPCENIFVVPRKECFDVVHISDMIDRVDGVEVRVDGVSYGMVEAGQKVELFGGGERDGQVLVDGEVREPSGE